MHNRFLPDRDLVHAHRPRFDPMAGQSLMLGSLLLLCIMPFAIAVVSLEPFSERDVYAAQGQRYPGSGDSSYEGEGTFRGAHLTPNEGYLVRRYSSAMGGYIELHPLCADGAGAGTNGEGTTCTIQTVTADLVTFCSFGETDLMVTVEHGAGPADDSHDPAKPTEKLRVYKFVNEGSTYVELSDPSAHLPKDKNDVNAIGLWGNKNGFFNERMLFMSCKYDPPQIQMSNEIGQFKILPLTEEVER